MEKLTLKGKEGRWIWTLLKRRKYAKINCTWKLMESNTINDVQLKQTLRF